MLARIPEEVINDKAPQIDGYVAIPFEVYLRFGRWQQILRESEPRKDQLVTTALWHYSRGIAYAALGRTSDARQEWRAFGQAMRIMPQGKRSSRSGQTLLPIADKMLLGEIVYREGNKDQAFTLLRGAVQDEDALTFAEPPYWLLPARHALGAAFIDAGRYAEAEATYRKDLEIHPENGWALYGLAECQRLQGRKDEAALTMARFQKAWAFADFKLSSSCCCLPGHCENCR
jgi:tetratricopeptide (TPR) repeat protein